MEDLSTRLLAFHRQFDRELATSSDRGVVILGASGVDTLLDELLAASTVETDRQTYGQAFSTYSNKAACALLFGLITEDEHRELRLLGSIRNKVAHQIDCDIRSGALRDQCMELKFCERHYAPTVIPFMETPEGEKYVPVPLPDPSEFPDVRVTMEDPLDPRERYVSSVRGLFDCLVARILTAARATSPAEFETDEPRLLVIDVTDPQQFSQHHGVRIDGMKARLAAVPDSPEKRRLEAETTSLEEEIRAAESSASLMVRDTARYMHAVVKESRRRAQASETP